MYHHKICKTDQDDTNTNRAILNGSTGKNSRHTEVNDHIFKTNKQERNEMSFNPNDITIQPLVTVT